MASNAALAVCAACQRVTYAGVKLCLVCCLTVVALASTLAAGCTKQLKLAPDPGLAADSLGVGIFLGQSLSDSKDAASKDEGAADVWVMTREELNTHDPYAERSDKLDLVVALYTEDPGDGSAAPTPFGYNAVDEIKCYLANSEKSAVEVLGERAVLLQPDSLQDKLGKPFLKPELATDGQLHFYYYFSYLPAEDSGRRRGKWAVKLVVSFAATGGCYAVDLAVCEPPQQL